MLPKILPKDTIYICSPAKAIDEESILFSKNHFEVKGYTVELSQNVLGSNHYFSGTEEERLFDLQKGLDHNKAKVILCARGGYGCIQLIEKLDWTEFVKNPKWIIGFSDITVLHLALHKIGIPSLHASMPLNFKSNSPLSLSTMLSAIKGNDYEISAPMHVKNKFGTSKNVVIGGNLAIVHSMLNYLDVDFFKDKILFLEDIGEHLYQIDRMLYGLKFYGAFNVISGLILGSFTNLSDSQPPYGKSIEDIILEHIGHRNIPIAFNFPCGHQNDNQAIIFGLTCELVTNAKGSRLYQPQNKPLH
jgi:muramoyltetrapeptide carboxypeptidase